MVAIEKVFRLDIMNQGQPQVTRSTCRALGADPGEPHEYRQSYSNAPREDLGRPGEANRTRPQG